MTLDRASFERLRDDLLERRAVVDRTIESLNVLLADNVLMSPRIVVPAPAVEPAKPRPAALAPPKPKQIAPPSKRVSSVHETAELADREQAEAMFMAGKKPSEIAAALGRSVGCVYQWSSKGKWKAKRMKQVRERPATQPPGTMPPPGPRRMRTAEELRAERRARDDRIIKDVRQQTAADARNGKAYSNFGRGAGGME